MKILAKRLKQLERKFQSHPVAIPPQREGEDDEDYMWRVLKIIPLDRLIVHLDQVEKSESFQNKNDSIYTVKEEK